MAVNRKMKVLNRDVDTHRRFSLDYTHYLHVLSHAPRPPPRFYLIAVEKNKIWEEA